MPSNGPDRRTRGTSVDAPDHPGFARFTYPKGIIVREQPADRHGTISLIEPREQQQMEPPGAADPMPHLKAGDVALVEFDPDEGVLRVQFIDVREQAAFERDQLSPAQPFILKSPQGGVWRTRLAARLHTRALPGRGRYSVEVAYLLAETETLSSPRATDA